MVYTIRRGFSPSPALRAWEGVISLSIWGLVALHLVGWLPDILLALDELSINMGETNFSLLSAIKLVIAVLIFVVMANWLSRVIENRARRSPHISPSMRVGLTKISKFLLYTIAFLFALNSVGINLTTFAVFSGAIGVGIGFGLQKVFSNFISGFILLFDRSIRPGDVISIGDRFGWVQALHARYVVVRDRDGVETLIPNENLITSEVTNWSYSDRTVRVRIPVQISYDDDPEQVMDILLECSENQPRVLKDPPPVARLMGFGDNGIDLELRVWLHDPEAGVGNVRSDINVAIWKQFKEHNISIPFPQRDVRMVNTTEP
jgi:small-conductance mechanosensitive channel